MGYTVKVNHPHFPEGTEFNVGGLGRVPNGSSVEVDEDMERTFLLHNGRALDEAFANDATTEISGNSALDKSEVDSVLAMFAEPEPEYTSDDAVGVKPDRNTDVFNLDAPNDNEGGE